MGREGLGQALGPSLLLHHLLLTQQFALAVLQRLVLNLELIKIVLQGFNVGHQPLLAVLQIGDILRQLGRNLLP